MRETIRNDEGHIIGWIHDEGCENEKCVKAIKEGRPVHAIPAGFCVTMSDYHFVDSFEAGVSLGMVAVGAQRKRRRVLRELGYLERTLQGQRTPQQAADYRAVCMLKDLIERAVTAFQAGDLINEGLHITEARVRWGWLSDNTAKYAGCTEEYLNGRTA